MRIEEYPIQTLNILIILKPGIKRNRKTAEIDAAFSKGLNRILGDLIQVI